MTSQPPPLPQSNMESVALEGVQRAPVFELADDRGPNLNVRNSRRRNDIVEEEEFDWSPPEEEIIYTPPSPPPPPPSPPPGPPSLGGTPHPETPPLRDTFDPTDYEKQVEADKYDERVTPIILRFKSCEIVLSLVDKNRKELFLQNIILVNHVFYILLYNEVT